MPSVNAWIKAFARQSNYTGTLSFDFIVDQHGDCSAIECNPRPTSGLHLMDGNIMAKAMLHGTVDTFDPECPAPLGRAQLALPTLFALPSLLKADHFLKKLADLAKSRDVIFDKSDPGPALYQIPCFIYAECLSIKRRRAVTACMTDGLEWNENHQARYHII